MIASFSAYAIGFLARPLGGLFFSHFGEKYGRKWVLVSTLFLMGAATFLIGCLPTYDSVGVWAPILLVVLRFLQGFGAGAEQAGGATLLTETAPLGRRGRLASFVMVGAALGTVLGALAWVLAQLLPEDVLMCWGWRLIFWASLFVTIGAWIIRMKMAESPIFVELKKPVDVEHPAPLKDVAKHGTKNVLKVIFMNWGISTQSYTYQVFMASYLITFVGVDKPFIPNVLLYGALLGSVAAYVMGLLSDRFGRRRMFLILAGRGHPDPVPRVHGREHRLALLDHRRDVARLHHRRPGHHRRHHELLPGDVRRPLPLRRRHPGPRVLLDHRRRYRPAGRGGLMAWFFNSWLPVAGYMVLTMVVSFLVARTVPETANRDLQILTDARDGEARPGLTEAEEIRGRKVVTLG